LPGVRTPWYITPQAASALPTPIVAAPGFAGSLQGGIIVASVEERVIDIVSENLGVSKEQVTRTTSFIEDLGADSLDIVELVMELEEEFEITIPDDQAEKIKTVGEAIDYIEREIAKK
jgi:acyl carrier protein